MITDRFKGGRGIFIMRRYRFKKLMRIIERLILRLLVVGLVLLVAVQFILTNSQLEEKIVTNIPWTQKLLTLGRQSEFGQPAEKVISTGTDSHHLRLTLQNKLPLKEVKLLVNGEVITNFNQPQQEVKLKPGDKIAIDARGCQQGLWFKITSLSANLSSLEAGQQLWIKDEYKVLGQVAKQNKF